MDTFKKMQTIRYVGWEDNIQVSMHMVVQSVRFTEVYMAEELDHDIFIGLDFIRRFKLKVNVEDKTIYFGQSSVKETKVKAIYLPDAYLEEMAGPRKAVGEKVAHKPFVGSVLEKAAQFDLLTEIQKCPNAKDGLGEAHFAIHAIKLLKDEIPYVRQPYRMPLSAIAALEEEVRWRVKAGILRASTSSYPSPGFSAAPN